MFRLTRRILQTLAALLLAAATITPAWATMYTDRATFISALGQLAPGAMTENFETRPLGAIANGQALGSFNYSFDGALVAPAVAADGNGGRALGGSPNDVFVGGDAVDLRFNGPAPLQAFGADFFYAPTFLPAPASIYRMALADGAASGATASNGPSLDPNGGSFFLGFIEDSADAFRAVRLFSVVPMDANGDPLFLDAGYQIDNLIFAAAVDVTTVPEPGIPTLLLLGVGVCAVRRQRKFTTTTHV